MEVGITPLNFQEVITCSLTGCCFKGGEGGGGLGRGRVVMGWGTLEDAGDELVLLKWVVLAGNKGDPEPKSWERKERAGAFCLVSSCEIYSNDELTS